MNMDEIKKKIYNFDMNIVSKYIIKILIASVIIIFVTIAGSLVGRTIQNINFHKKLKKAGVPKSKVATQERIKKKRDNIAVLLSILVKYSIYLFGFFIVFGYLGFDTSLILAAFGTCGIAIALGLQGSLSNFVAGILITLTGTFKTGNIIETNVDKGQGMNDSLTGKIVDYDFLTFRIKDINTGLLYSIPNNLIWGSVVSNYNHFNDQIYVTVKVVVSQNNDLRKVIKLIKEVCMKDKQVIKEDTWPSPFINMIDSENLCGVTVLVKFLTNVNNYPNIEDTIQNDIILKLRENNVNLRPCPGQTEDKQK